MCGAAIGIKSVRLGIGIKAKRLCFRHLCGLQSRLDITLDIKLAMAGPARCKESRIVRIGPFEACAKTAINLIARLRNAWANDRGNAAAQCAKRHHGINRPVSNACQCAPPPGMGSADNSCLRIGQQNRSAIRSQYTKQQAGPVCNQRIGPRPGVIAPWIAHCHAIGGMDLIDRDQFRAGPDRLHRKRAVFLDKLWVIARSRPTIQPGDCPA